MQSSEVNYSYSHQRPTLAADIVLLGLSSEKLCLLLVQRGIEPFKGQWCLPGGHVDADENLAHAAARELSEETSINVSELRQVATFADIGRDPRGWTASVVHFAAIAVNDSAPKAADDAADCRWFALDELPELAFDHAEIVAFTIDSLGWLAPNAAPHTSNPASTPRLIIWNGNNSSISSGAIPIPIKYIRQVLSSSVSASRASAIQVAAALAAWPLRSGHDVLIAGADFPNNELDQFLKFLETAANFVVIQNA